MAEALAEVVAGKPVAVPETAADGCLIARAEKRAARTDVTFARDVAPILQRRCEACHREGQTAPFTLSGYDDAVKHAAMIKEVTAQRRMPPWHAGVRQTLHRAREKFAELLLDAVADSLDAATRERLAEELEELGLLDYCKPVLERWGAG